LPGHCSEHLQVSAQVLQATFPLSGTAHAAQPICEPSWAGRVS
jgi:hypothetical protein